MRLAFVDGLRCLAVFAVVSQHYAESAFPQGAKPFLSLGPGVFGVALFFMISGYVIPLSVKRTDNIYHFLIRRLFRILPLYWLTLALVIGLGALGVAPFTAKIQVLDWASLLTNLLLVFEYTNDPALIGVSWSLSLEFVWYGLFCLFFWFGGQNRCIIACLTCSGLLIICGFVAVAIDHRLPFGRMLMLHAALMGYARYCYDMRRFSARAFLQINAAFICAVATCLWIGFDLFEHPNVNFSSNITAWSLSYFIFTISYASKLIKHSSALTSPIFSYLGLWSFSIYLLHEPIKNLLVGMLNGWLLVLTALVMTTVLSSITYRFIERPGVWLGLFLTASPTLRPKISSNPRLFMWRKF